MKIILTILLLIFCSFVNAQKRDTLIINQVGEDNVVNIYSLNKVRIYVMFSTDEFIYFQLYTPNISNVILPCF